MTIPQTYKHIPALRFPEFVNDEEWEEDSVENLFTFLPNNTLSRAELNYENGTFLNIHYGDVLIKFDECLNVKKEVLPHITDDNIANKYRNSILKNGDIIIADTAEDESVGKCTEVTNITDELVVPGLHTIAIRPKREFASRYLGFYMNSDSYRSQLFRLMQGIKVTSLSKSALKATTIRFPSSIEEQGRIAELLSSMDRMIAEYDKKLELLKSHKEGLMQQLFTPPTRSSSHAFIPKLRFPVFNNTKGWEIKKLGDCFTERVERNAIELPLLSLTESDGIVLQEETNRKNNSNADKSKYLRVCIGDIAYNTMRMWQGRCALVAIEGIVSPAYTICKPNVDMNPSFFYYLFKTSRLIEAFHGNSQGLVNDTLNLKYDSFAKINAQIPLLAEQNCIADCLSSADEIINLYSEMITILLQYKKGLLQQMFPNSPIN